MIASEFRIGNLVFDGKEIFTVNGRILAFFDYDLKPIPITKEWLIKFGFEQHAIGYYNLKGFFICYANTGLHEYKFRDFNVTIKYVHQLQNLYFALTQEELTISE